MKARTCKTTHGTSRRRDSNTSCLERCLQGSGRFPDLATGPWPRSQVLVVSVATSQVNITHKHEMRGIHHFGHR